MKVISLEFIFALLFLILTCLSIVGLYHHQHEFFYKKENSIQIDSCKITRKSLNGSKEFEFLQSLSMTCDHIVQNGKKRIIVFYTSSGVAENTRSSNLGGFLRIANGKTIGMRSKKLNPDFQIHNQWVLYTKPLNFIDYKGKLTLRFRGDKNVKYENFKVYIESM